MTMLQVVREIGANGFETIDFLLPKQIVTAHIIGPPSFETTPDHVNPRHSAEIAYNIACAKGAEESGFIARHCTFNTKKKHP